jgi:formylglycine-generating enzyme required for sulfatase activity
MASNDDVRALPGKTAALVVAIEDYDSPDFAPPLPGPAAAADGFVNWLVGRHVPRKQIRRLTARLGGNHPGDGDRPTHDAVIHLLHETLRQLEDQILGPPDAMPLEEERIDSSPDTERPAGAPDENLLIVFWCGHGIEDDRENRRLLYTNTTQNNALTLNVTELLGYLQSRRFRHDLVIIDACANPGIAQILPGVLPEETFTRPWSLAVEPPPPAKQFVLWSVQEGQRATFAEGRSIFFEALRPLLKAAPRDRWPPPMSEIAEDVRDGCKRVEAPMPEFWLRRWSGEQLSHREEARVLNELKAARKSGRPERLLPAATRAWLTYGDEILLPTGFNLIRLQLWTVTRPGLLPTPQREMLAEAWKRQRVPLIRAGTFVLLTVLIGLGVLVAALHATRCEQFTKDLESTAPSFNEAGHILGLADQYAHRWFATPPGLARCVEAEVLKKAGAEPETPLDPDQPNQLSRHWQAAALALGAAGIDPAHLPAPELLGTPEHPTAREYFLQALPAVLPDPQGVALWLEDADSRYRQARGAGRTSPAASAELVYSLLLALGAEDYKSKLDPVIIPSKLGPKLNDKQGLRAWLSSADGPLHDPDPGIHSAAAWLLRSRLAVPPQEIDAQIQWVDPGGTPARGGDDPPKPALTDPRTITLGPDDPPRWCVTPEGIPMTIFPPCRTITLGGASKGHCRTIGRSFALAMTEVTNAQFQMFLECHPEVRAELQWEGQGFVDEKNSDLNQPVTYLHWNATTRFCNWLSARARPCLPACYREIEVERGAQKVKRMIPTDEALSLGGYRLPTEAEWEFACRARTDSWWSFGNDRGAMVLYALDPRFTDPPFTMKPAGSFRPNAFGLFDMYGNAAEWCHDFFENLGSQPPSNRCRPDLPPPFDPRRPQFNHVVRNGPRGNEAEPFNSYQRENAPFDRSLVDWLGFRVARTIRVASCP